MSSDKENLELKLKEQYSKENSHADKEATKADMSNHDHPKKKIIEKPLVVELFKEKFDGDKAVEKEDEQTIESNIPSDKMLFTVQPSPINEVTIKPDRNALDDHRQLWL